MSAFDTTEMSVIKRNGMKETMSFDKILKRIKKMGMMGVVDKEDGIKINYSAVAMKIISQLYDGISSNMLDEITAEQLVNLSSSNPDYETLATRIVISNHHKNTNPSFSKTMKRLREENIVSEEFYKNIQVNAKALDAMCDFQRDYLITYFGFKTLEKSYLLSIKKKVYERPQYMFLRVAIALHGTDLEKIQETYDALSKKFCIHGTPTMYNAGTNRQQLSSCFVKDTMVHTLRGPVPIQDVKIGDKVITHTGHVQPVKQVHTNQLGDRKLHEVSIYKTNPFTVTEDHNLYVYDTVSEVAGWKAVCDLKPNTDYVMIPKNKYQLYAEEGKKKDIDVKINRFFGMWLRHGGFLYCDKAAVDMEVHIGEDEAQEEPRSSEDLIGIEVTLPYTPELEETVMFCSTEVSCMFGDVMVEKHHAKDGQIQIRYLHKPMARDFMSWFVDQDGRASPGSPGLLCPGRATLAEDIGHEGSKTIPPGFFANASHWTQAFLSGWNVVASTSIVQVPVEASECASEIYALCRLHGIDHETFLPLDTTEDSQVIIHDDFIYLQFMESRLSERVDSEVYTLGVENDHSYSIEGIVAQNCYLIAMEEDSIEGIYNTLRDCALISKWAGGIGLHIHNIRATGSHIAGTNGVSNGIVPMLRVFNHTAKYVDQCVHPNTIIYTTQGPKAIQNVVEGETAIFNQMGETEIIQKVLEHTYVGDMLEIETTFSGTPLDITAEHPVYAVRGGSTGYSVEERINNDRAELEWIDAGKLELGDMIAYPIPTYEKDISGIDHEDCYMYGVLLTSWQRVTVPYSIHVSTMSLPVQRFIQRYLTDRCVKYDLIYEAELEVEEPNTDNDNETEEEKEEENESMDKRVLTDIVIQQSSNLPFRHSDIFNEDGNCHIASRWLNLPIVKSCMIIKGLVDSGGSIQNKIFYETTSLPLAHSLRFLCLKFGVLSKIFGQVDYQPPTTDFIDGLRPSEKLRGDYISNVWIPATQKICTLLELEYDGRTVPYFRYKDCLLNPITSIISHEYDGILYDLQMTVQHDYLLSEGLVHNGGGKRNGSFAIYMEPWHADIEVFLQMRKNHGEEELKARDLFYALWMPDLFMKRVKENGKWTLMCPHECPGLADVWGDKFESLYTKYEEEGRGRSTVQARDLWFKILDAQMETGTPYLLYKDAANRKSNQQNLGTIKSSNLCVAPETLILTDQGHLPIQSLHGQQVNVWNGKEFSEVEIVQTGKQQKLIEVHTSDNHVLHCTLYHKFWIQDDVDPGSLRIVEAQCLVGGEPIAAWDDPETGRQMVQTITKVVDNGRIDDTYCFTEPKEHAGIFNGIYTSQCSEIIQYSDEKETSVCNLASIALPSFIENGQFDFEKLHKTSRMVTRNLNRIIDINYYPTPKTERSNFRHRPIGLGVQGLADTFIMMDMAFGSEPSRLLNKQIFETIYHASLVESCEIAKVDGHYETFPGSPASEGRLQFDLWEAEPLHQDPSDPESPYRYDWTALKADIVKYGIRNSLLLAPMPTASTSQILGFNECIEPITSNIFSRRTMAGEFIVTNKYLMRDLIDLGVWNEKIKNHIIANNGSIQGLDMVPENIREKYKTVWEIPMRTLIDMSADRGIYIDQSQSLNLWIEDPNYNSLTSMHFYSWSKGLKTGIYYLRRRAKHQAQQFTIEPEKANVDHQEEDDICEMCSG